MEKADGISFKEKQMKRMNNRDKEKIRRECNGFEKEAVAFSFAADIMTVI